MSLFKHSIFDWMENLLKLFFLLFTVAFTYSCNFKVTGIYGVNLAEGWKNYTDEQGNHYEVIPEIPRYQYFELKWNGKVKWFHYDDGIKKYNGMQHWKMKEDTVIIYFHSKRMWIDTVLFKKTNYKDKYWFSYMNTDSSSDSRFLKKCFGDRKVFYAVNKYSDGR